MLSLLSHIKLMQISSGTSTTKNGLLDWPQSRGLKLTYIRGSHKKELEDRIRRKKWLRGPQRAVKSFLILKNCNFGHN